MKSNIYIFIFIISSLIISSTSFSKNNIEKSLKQATKIIYYYYDSSVPPQYHRSYTITITKGTLRIVVDSYGEILNDKEFEVDSSKIELIKKSIIQNKIRKGNKLESKGCTGGTSDKLEYFAGDEQLFSASVYHCGGKDYGDMRGDIKKVAQVIKELIPNFSELLKRGY